VKLGNDVMQRLPPASLDSFIAANSAIDMLMKFGDVKRAEQVFEQSKSKNLVTYGAMMRGK
jgi:pentatricopeptide repeat protein